MPAEQCIYDNAGRCIRTVTDFWADGPDLGQAPPFSTTHLPLWLIAVILGVLIIFRFLRWAFGTLESGPGRLATIPCFLAAVFVSMAISNLIFDHGMRPSETGIAFGEASQQLNTAWQWVINFRT